MSEPLDWRARLAACATPAEREPLLRAAPEHAAAEIQALLVTLLYTRPAEARALREAGLELAALAPGDRARSAYAQRGTAHVHYAEGRYAEAVEAYQLAARLFAEAGLPDELARTRSSGLQSLILLSRYAEAQQWADEAEGIFLQAGDVLRLARLDTNMGNVYFRQDRALDAVTRYRRALDGFGKAGEPKDTAATLSNLAVAHTNLGEFAEALSAYQQARECSVRHGLLPLAAQADYNIAYLHFLRGDYAHARAFYHQSRQRSSEAGDAYHLALCDLDEAEMSLELNLTHEGESLARRAADRFGELGLKYEQAKALVNLAVADSQKRVSQAADEILRQARAIFAEDNNELWPSLVDLLRAVVAYRQGRWSLAKSASNRAWKTLSRSRMPGRAAHCQILQGRLWLREGLADRARATSRDALEKLGSDAPPSLRFHAKLLEGEAEELSGRWAEAMACYQASRNLLEELRGRLHREDLRISLLNDKLAVYDGLLNLCLNSPLASQYGVAEALLIVQQAKSRSLADRLLAGSERRDDAAAPEIDSLRQDLDACYRQIEFALLMERAGNPAAPVRQLKQKARAIEASLLELRGKSAGDAADGVLVPAHTVEELQGALGEDAVFLEYFETRGQLYLFALSRHQAPTVHRLGTTSGVRQAVKLLQFQLGRYRTQFSKFEVERGEAATRHHLAQLNDALLGPVRGPLRQFRRWIVAPHRYLHGVPFAALEQNGVPLFEEVELSHAPSASVLAAGHRRSVAAGTDNWVIAVPDARNPSIEEEARLIARRMPGSRLACGESATLAIFEEAASSCNVLHLAAHGTFRQDNPFFSSLQLADGRLSLFDLARMRLNAGLVVLSACSSGQALAVGGDELLGLMRGFLAAGAQRLLVALWEVDDQGTLEFMDAFYRYLAAGAPAATALRQAMGEVRRLRPHPYFWAPFILVET